MNIAKSKMLKACQAPWCTAHRYSSFPAKSHVIPVSLPSVHSLLAAELGSKSSDRGARVNIHIYIYIGLKVRSICLLRGCSISFEWISELWVVVLLFWPVPASIKHIWVVKEKGGSSNVYVSMHLPLLRVEVLGSKSSGRHTYTGAIQHDRVAHLAAVSKDMPVSVASSVKALPPSEEITLTDQTEFNDLSSLSKNVQLSGCIIVV